MDIQRPASNAKRNRHIGLAGLAAVALASLTTIAVRLAARPVGVDGDALWSAVVMRGEFIHEIAAAGSLIAPEIRSVTNRSEGVVERIAVLPGHVVTPDDVLIELSSPQLADELQDARYELEAAEAEERLRQAEAADRLLDLRASVASAEAEYTSARLESEAQSALGEAQIVSALDIEQARIRAEQLLKRLEAEQAKLDRYPQTRAAQDDAAMAKLEQQRQKLRRLEEQFEDLAVRAGITGVVQEIGIEEGERLTAGSEVAKIVNPKLLIARVRVSERDAARVEIGQPVRLEMARETIDGRVTRIDPTVRERLVTVDVELVGDVGSSLRPDTSVTARIELDRVADTVLLDRPTGLRDEQEAIQLFRLIDDGQRAERVTVEVGRASSRQVEILSGLEPGDAVILADMSEWTTEPVVRIR